GGDRLGGGADRRGRRGLGAGGGDSMEGDRGRDGTERGGAPIQKLSKVSEHGVSSSLTVKRRAGVDAARVASCGPNSLSEGDPFQEGCRRKCDTSHFSVAKWKRSIRSPRSAGAVRDPERGGPRPCRIAPPMSPMSTRRDGPSPLATAEIEAVWIE